MLRFVEKKRELVGYLRRILKSTVRIAIIRNAIPVYQRLNVRKKTIIAMIAAGNRSHIALRTRRIIAIPMMTRAINPMRDMTSKSITWISILLSP
jgi:hypothetical protein